MIRLWLSRFKLRALERQRAIVLEACNGFLTRVTSPREASRTSTPSELERARLLREAARARYLDAVSRHDTRDMHAYEPQFVKATNRVLALEAGRTA